MKKRLLAIILLAILPLAAQLNIRGGGQFPALMQERSFDTSILSSTGTTTVLNVTEKGILHLIDCLVGTALTGGTNVTTMDMEITIDGTTRVLSIYANNDTFDNWICAPAGAPCTGSGIGDNFNFELHDIYDAGLQIDLVVTAEDITAGAITCAVLRSTAVN